MASYKDKMRVTEWDNPSINIQSVAATTTGTAVDITGYIGQVRLFVPVGALSDVDGTAYLTFKVTEADTTTDSYTDLPATQYDFGNGWDGIIDAAGEADAGYILQFTPSVGKNAVKAIATETGSITSAVIGAYFFWETRHGATTT